MTTVNFEALERNLGRKLTKEERDIAEACVSISGLGFICIQEGVPLKAATRIATLMGVLLVAISKQAAQNAAAVVAMERLSPGSLTDDDKEPRN